jgi:hypothetical protein
MSEITLAHPIEFRSPAYRSLVKALGESDAVVEWIEVGVREVQFVSESNGLEAAKELASKHGVFVNVIPLSDLRNRCARLELLSVNQQAEHFFRLFRKTHPRQMVYSRADDDDALTSTLESFNLNPAKVGQLEHDIFQYYRDARNLIMHDPERDQRKSQKRQCDKLRAQVAESNYKTLAAPNYIDSLCFDDFILFTRSLKQLAANLCDATVPTDEELAASVLATTELMRKLKFLEGNQTRRAHTVVGFLRERYSILVARAEQICKLVLDETR